MQEQGEFQKAFGRFPKACGSFSNGIQDDTVRNSSSHCVSDISARLPVKRDPRNHCERRYSPSEESDPLGDGSLKKDEQEETSGIRNEIKNILRLYREILRKLVRESNRLGGRVPNIHQKAADVLQKSNNFLNGEKRIGIVPGVEIGDEFQHRAELVIVGLHHQYTNGIDYMDYNGTTTLAISVIASDVYENTVNSFGELIYTGEGGNPRVRSHHPKDQVLKRGNLALKNSMDQRSPVRVIRKQTYQNESSYVYDGLHLVERYWCEKGLYNKFVYKFQFRRMDGQPRDPLGYPMKLSESLLHKQGIIIEDLSRGKEKVPIVVVNTIDAERPSGFTYTTNVASPMTNACKGCDCDDGCSDSEDCSCKVKNGRKFKYDFSECLETRSPFVYECGPSCKCFDSCINKVSQRGIRFQLEVFRTESKGWGVRSRTHIPSGSFICEYVGEILKLNEVYQNGTITDNEYLFVIGNNTCFGDNDVINAARKGNVGRFINHSCSPNLRIQNVYIGSHSKLPHIMLFAMNDIAPFEELTYDYRFRLGGKNWNLQAKNCKCGSSNCFGKFY
ncbi:histone-lysine N-methyltransferase, H3 lysine-9 specific SUVH5-like [Euphorbia lathyris]|uniref:histone-lysine N-methyltransferase, H3 lysine-9 specific SUVH5-like n=1 Tax=Euphorbia lathyris TaxID=212925 RepID=UPI00331408EE